MKRCTLIVLLIVIGTITYSQIGINKDGSDTHSSAILDIKSTNLGVLIPRMTQTQRNVISNPAEGLLIYQTDGKAGFYYNKSGIWTAISQEISSGESPLYKDNDTLKLNNGVYFSVDSITTESIKIKNNLDITGDLVSGSDIIVDGFIKAGPASTVSCNSDNAGALRYNPTIGCIEFCHENKWSCSGNVNDPCSMFGNPNFNIKVNNLSQKSVCIAVGNDVNLMSFQDGSWGDGIYFWTGPSSFTYSEQNPGNFTMTTSTDGWYKCTLKNATAPGCFFTDSVRIITDQTIISQPSDLLMCDSRSDSLTLEAKGKNLIYTWQFYKNTGDINDNSNWSNVNTSTGSNFSLSKTGNLIIKNGNGLNGNKYRVLISGDCGSNPLVSEISTITHIPKCFLQSCKDFKEYGYTESGIYTIDLDGMENGEPEFNIFCDMSGEGQEIPSSVQVKHYSSWWANACNGTNHGYISLTNGSDYERPICSYKVYKHRLTYLWSGQFLYHWSENTDYNHPIYLDDHRIQAYKEAGKITLADFSTIQISSTPITITSNNYYTIHVNWKR